MGNVLIIARDEVVAALLGLLVELQGFSPRFPEGGQSPEEAVANGRFSVAVLDCDHPQWSEDLVRSIKAADARPILFSPFRTRSEMAQLASRYAASAFTLPTDPETFGRILRS